MNLYHKFRTYLVISSIFLAGSCNTGPGQQPLKNDLSSIGTASLTLDNRIEVTAYVADNTQTRTIGLMNTSEIEIPSDHGMLFVFDSDQPLSFWMRNTIIPLDIAYIRSDGTIVKTYTMEPLNEIGYPSIEYAKYALELRAGKLAEWNIAQGHHVAIPADVQAAN